MVLQDEVKHLVVLLSGFHKKEKKKKKAQRNELMFLKVVYFSPRVRVRVMKRVRGRGLFFFFFSPRADKVHVSH